MENQTGRKLKMFRYDHVEEYNDSFLQFSQNNSTVTHFTNEKVGVAKEMNNVLLEKERYLLSNALLEKLF